MSQNRFDQWVERQSRAGRPMCTNQAIGDAIGVTDEAVRLWRLDFGDDDRTVPRKGAMARLQLLVGATFRTDWFYSPGRPPRPGQVSQSVSA